MRSLPLPETGLPAFAALLGSDLWDRWALAGQVFPLAKAPHAYVADTTGATERGYRAAATIWVDGVAWN